MDTPIQNVAALESTLPPPQIQNVSAALGRLLGDLMTSLVLPPCSIDRGVCKSESPWNGGGSDFMGLKYLTA